MMLTTIQILTIGGTCPWIEDDSLEIERDILHPNGIYLTSKPITKRDFVLCPVDSTTTAMDDFYRWKDVESDNKEIFCWRTFHIAGDETNYKGWLNVPLSEQFGSYSYIDLFDAIHEVSKR